MKFSETNWVTVQYNYIIFHVAPWSKLNIIYTSIGRLYFNVTPYLKQTSGEKLLEDLRQN